MAGSDEQGTSNRNRPPVPDDRLHKVRDLSQIDNADMVQLRRLSGFQRRAFLFELTDNEVHADLDRFLGEIVDGNRTAAEWSTEVIRVPLVELADLVRVPLVELLTEMARTDGSWRVIVPDAERWRKGLEFEGAPCVLRRRGADADAGDRTIDLSAAQFGTRPVDDPLIAGRRWIATRMAQQWTGVDRPFAPEDLADLLGVPLDRWTDDARRAAAALVVEREAFPDCAIPGSCVDEAVLGV